MTRARLLLPALFAILFLTATFAQGAGIPAPFSSYSPGY